MTTAQCCGEVIVLTFGQSRVEDWSVCVCVVYSLTLVRSFDNKLLTRESARFNVNVMALSSQLVVPMTIWGRRAPSHSICCVVLTKDNTTLVTGSHEGQLCIWDDYEGQLVPRSMLHGHTSKVEDIKWT